MSVKSKLIFPYTQLKVYPFPSSQRSISIFRPIIPVTIIYKTKLVQFQALVDSGADFNIFHADIAMYLGINLTKGFRRNITGISGKKIKGYEHPVKLRVGAHMYKSSITFSNQLPTNALAVLGNKGFFNEFIVVFNHHRRLIKLKTKK